MSKRHYNLNYWVITGGKYYTAYMPNFVDFFHFICLILPIPQVPGYTFLQQKKKSLCFILSNHTHKDFSKSRGWLSERTNYMAEVPTGQMNDAPPEIDWCSYLELVFFVKEKKKRGKDGWNPKGSE